MTASSIARLVDCSRTFTIGDNEVLAMQHIDLGISAGEFTALCGPSGSGKTTSLNVLGGLDSPNHGQVFLGDTELSSLSQKERARLRLMEIGFVFQAYNLIPVLSARENVAFVLELQGKSTSEALKAADVILDDVGLSAQRDRRPHEMSGGQQQRVAVARAVVTEPKLVLADEPTANLDSQTAVQLLELFARLNEERGVTLVFSTHDPRVMSRARRVVTLEDGKIVDDQTRAVKESAASESSA
ncbi:MAG: ABC transporter ATP-binding protein [Deltaproteobacteria bacterium]|nr:ABC transporter ATP-binding protein [Deltaproteobacteria bacterium]